MELFARARLRLVLITSLVRPGSGPDHFRPQLSSGLEENMIGEGCADKPLFWARFDRIVLKETYFLHHIKQNKNVTYLKEFLKNNNFMHCARGRGQAKSDVQ